jgi:hypothetical protein
MEPSAPRPATRPSPFRPTWAALLLVAVLPGCRQPEARRPDSYTVRLYDIGDSRRLVCDLAPSGADGAQGVVQGRIPGGESFQGEWTRLAWQKAGAAATGDAKYPNSLPVLPAQANPLEATWGWAAELGVDFDHFPSSYWSFFMYGSGGTRISGFFLDRTAGQGQSIGTRVRKLFDRQAKPTQAHLLGAARDNQGRRYKLIGTSTEGTMEITSTRPVSRPTATAPAGAAGRTGAAAPAAKDKAAAGGASAFQDQLDTASQAQARDSAAAAVAPAARDRSGASAQVAAEAEAASKDGVSTAKVFAYGALGVDAPEGETEDQKGDYKAGQWTGAAVKVGGILALLA